MLNNTTLSPEFNYLGLDQFKQYVDAADGSDETAGILNGKAYTYGVAELARVGFNLETWEIGVRNHFGVESKRGGGARSKGTGYVMPKTPKTYKHYMGSAIESGIELLNAAGVPRELAEIKEALKELREPKAAEEKLLGLVDTFLKVKAECDPHDARTVDAINVLLNHFRAEGYEITLSLAAVA